MLGNTLESIIGAIYIDKGMQACEKFILKHILQFKTEGFLLKTLSKIINEPLTLLKSGSFHRYRHLSESEKIEVVSNRSLKGFLDTKDKKVNYFLKIEKPFFERQKTNLISKLNDVSEILLIFEVDLEKDTNKKELFYD